jgi:bacteriocin biosynthesis cyclodehydratase domain-containing protein
MKSQVWIYQEEDFGVAVGTELQKQLHDRVLSYPRDAASIDGMLRSLNRSDIFIFISPRPRDAACRVINAGCCKIGCTFLPVIVDTESLIVGPLVQVPGTPCWECWNTRERANYHFADQRAALRNYYDQESCKSPIGYMPYLVGVAAGKLAGVLNNSRLFKEQLGRSWAINLWTREISQAAFVGRHACPHCGVHDLDGTIGLLFRYCR